MNNPIYKGLPPIERKPDGSPPLPHDPSAEEASSRPYSPEVLQL